MQAASPITFTVQNDKPRITRISSVDYPNNAAGEPSGIGGSIAVNTMGAASVAYKFGSEPSATTNCPTATAGGTGGIALTDANGVATITIPPSLPAGLTNVYVRPFTTSGITDPDLPTYAVRVSTAHAGATSGSDRKEIELLAPTFSAAAGGSLTPTTTTLSGPTTTYSSGTARSYAPPSGTTSMRADVTLTAPSDGSYKVQIAAPMAPTSGEVSISVTQTKDASGNTTNIPLDPIDPFTGDPQPLTIDQYSTVDTGITIASLIPTLQPGCQYRVSFATQGHNGATGTYSLALDYLRLTYLG
ncbi:MAG TPA: hypothetical protein PK868_10300 [Phycicoccus sp.]|nr:hypothetical protein [Phycicoccus sp.]HQK32570.1 hypothetical protein [Phycicoccus sp.]